MFHSPCETSGTCDTSLRKQNDFNLPKTRGFKIASLNITSLPKHLDELRLNMINQHLDILILNETRLDDTISTVTLKFLLINTTSLEEMDLDKEVE